MVATNLVGTIDQAVTRRGRFDLILPLGPPDFPSRIKIVQQELKNPGARELSVEEVDLVGKYTMGYAHAEVVDFVKELLALEKFPEDLGHLNCELWRIRQERVPVALSGSPGCNWRTFRDEALRYRRAVKISEKIPQDYWDEPWLPKLDSD